METSTYQDVNQHVVERCKGGDNRAQYELYKLYSKAMFNVSMRITNDYAEAEDVLQEAFISAFGYKAMAAPSSMYPLMNLSVNDIFIARIIEGCNSISLLILFLAFMLSFIGKLKPSLIFILSGMVIIYSMNVIRIALLAIGLYEMPQYSHFLHKIAFPLVIYGTVFLLWILWIYIYSKTSRE